MLFDDVFSPLVKVNDRREESSFSFDKGSEFLNERISLKKFG